METSKIVINEESVIIEATHHLKDGIVTFKFILKEAFKHDDGFDSMSVTPLPASGFSDGQEESVTLSNWSNSNPIFHTVAVKPRHRLSVYAHLKNDGFTKGIDVLDDGTLRLN